MVRVLHLLRPDADFQTRRSVLHLSRDLGDGFSAVVRTVGRGGDLRGPVAAWRALRTDKTLTADVVHSWGTEPLAAAALAGRGRLVFGPDRFLDRTEIKWLRAVAASRPLEIVCPTATLQREMVRRGLPLQRCHLIRPGVEFARIRRRRNALLRHQLGLAEEDFVLLAPGESTPQTNHALALWATSMLHVMDERYRLVVWGHGPEVARLKRLAGQLEQKNMLVCAADRLGDGSEFEELLAVTDAVLESARGPAPTLPVCICMAAGLPIVSTVTYTLAELLEDRHTALMVGKSSPRQLAQRVLDLRHDSRLQWSISDMARTEAYEYFSLTRFLNQYRTAYRQVAAGQPVQAPPPPPGAGMRFHGNLASPA